MKISFELQNADLVSRVVVEIPDELVAQKAIDPEKIATRFSKSVTDTFASTVKELNRNKGK